MYCFTVLVFSLIMIYAVAPRYGRSSPLVYISICSTVGSVSVMAIKGFGVAVKLTVSGNNQFSHPSTYVFGIVVVLCILVQMNYFNKALDTFSTNV
jgi:magnesium transporter